MADPILARALVRWQHAAGPFWPYVCATPFLGLTEGAALARAVRAEATGGTRGSLPVAAALAARLEAAAGDVEAVRVAGCPAGGASADRSGGPSSPAAPESGPAGHSRRPREVRPAARPVAVLADLPVEATLAAAPLLAARGWYVVPVVQRWIASPAVLPCRRLIARLVAGAGRVQRPRVPRGVVLLADGERTGRPGARSQPRGRVFDNRYEYQICRFPSPAFLAGEGIERIRWIVSAEPRRERPAGAPASVASAERWESMPGRWAGGPPAVAHDLVPYQESLLRAGIAVEVVAW